MSHIAKPHDGVLAMRLNDGTLVFWYDTKTLTWATDIKRPTFQDAFQGKGRYYQFNSDGSILAKIDGVVHQWGVQGQILEVHVCPNADGTYFLDGEDCPCNRCTACNKLAPDSYFCSSVCEDSLR